MAEPHFNPDQSQSASDEALEQALEKVRREARARAREQRERQASAVVARTTPAPARQRNNPTPAAAPRETAAQQSASRPSALFALAVVIIAALGFVGIQRIHATTPAIKGFATSEALDEAQMAGTRPDANGPDTDLTSPVTAALMRTQGWVLPSHVSTVDPALEKIRAAEHPDLPSEIAQVPALEMDIDPAQELASLTAAATEPAYNEELPLPPPPPPVFGGGRFPATGFGNGPAGTGFAGGAGLALPPLQRAAAAPDGNVMAEPQAGTPGAPLGDNQANPQPIPGGSMLDEINRSDPNAQPPAPTQQARAPAEPDRTAAPAPSLARLQEQQCSRLGFFSRISCNDDLRQQFCAKRWNQHPECTRAEPTNNF